MDHPLEKKAKEVFDRARAVITRRKEASELATLALQEHQRGRMEVDTAIVRSKELLRRTIK